MKSNARCWTPLPAALLIVMLLLSACAMAGSDAPVLCPPLVDYSATDRQVPPARRALASNLPAPPASPADHEAGRVPFHHQ